MYWFYYLQQMQIRTHKNDVGRSDNVENGIVMMKACNVRFHVFGVLFLVVKVSE